MDEFDVLKSLSEVYGDCDNHCSTCSKPCAMRDHNKKASYLQTSKHSEINKVIGIVSGKGGVGKSLVSSLLTVMFRRRGYKVGLFDGDVTGPSIPKSFGITGVAEADERGILPPITRKGSKIMSVNLLLENNEAPVLWRGSVISDTIRQFWSQVAWGKIDYMFIDMPPGTGDVPLTVFQNVPLDGIVVVTTPQDLVSMIVGKAVIMAQDMNVPVVGLIENFSYTVCPHCGEQMKIYGQSHVEEVAAKFDVPIISRLPIDPVVTDLIDIGKVEQFEGTWLDSTVDYIEKKFPIAK
jgi:Mrp family chromosome partitioning ATPase